MVLLLSGLFLYGWFETYLTNVLLLDPGYKMTMSFGATCSTPAVYKKITETKAQWTRTFPNATYGEEVSSQLNPLYAIAIPVNL